MVGRSSPESQCEWALNTLGFNFFSTKRADKLVPKCVKDTGAVQDCHRQLWPGQPVPQVEATSAGGEYATKFVPTSVMIAYVLHMSTSAARPIPLKKMAFELLRALFDKACAAGGFVIQHLQFSADLTSAVWAKQQLDAPTDFVPWDQNFYVQNIAMSWSYDLANPKKPCVASAPPNVHPADFVCYAMDTPRDLRRSMPQAYAAKVKLQTAALSLLTQLAVYVDANLASVTLPLQANVARPRQAAAKHQAASKLMGCFRRARKKRTPAASVWELRGRAVEMLFSQEDAACSVACSLAIQVVKAGSESSSG